jgi:uridine kinase
MRTLITVDGIDGSGKSTFARRIADTYDAAGIRTLIVRVDDFRRAIDWTKTDGREADVYYDEYYDFDLCQRCVKAFLDGERSIEIPAYDTRAERVDGTRVLDFDGTQIVLIEGVFPRRIPSAKDALAIYLAVGEDEARRRIIARDLKKGRTKQEIERRIDRRYFPSQRRYHALFSPAEKADVLVANERTEAPQIQRRDLHRLHPELRAILDGVLGPA